WRVFNRVEIPSRDDSSNPFVIDFVVLIPGYHSVICNQMVQNDSSTDQVRDVMSTLKDHFENYFDSNSLLSLGGIGILARDTDYVIWLTKDNSYTTQFVGSDELVETLENYVGVLYNAEWTEIEEWEKAREQMDELQHELEMTDMTTKTIYRYDLETSRRELLRLTLDQLNSLQRMQDNDRCLIKGAAGTGKTVLAMELAKQRCEDGETVALLCSNPNLSQRFEKWAEKLSNENSGQILAGTPASLLSLVFGNNDSLKKNHMERLQKSAEPETGERFSKLETTLRLGSLDNAWEDFITNSIADLKEGGLGSYFDYLIVDEAQNLCRDVFLKLMNELLKGGLVTGHWSMFGDFDHQDLVSFNFREGTDAQNESGEDEFQWLRELNEFGEHDAQWLRELNKQLSESGEPKFKWWYNDELETNCRNTHEVADAVARLAEVTSPAKSGVHGPPIERKYFRDDTQLGDMLNDVIATWERIGYESRQIILLSSVSGAEFDTERSYHKDWRLLNISEVSEDDQGETKVEDDPGKLLVPGGPSQGEILRYSDVYDFQGLESDLAILVMPKTTEHVEIAKGITLPQVEHLNRVLYTGMSRAKMMLIILAHESYKDRLERRWESYDWLSH
ncbi:MAG: DUF2075 domain-containing protein, partial [Candidatus Poribacteria bacterium]|nr:DUF2075 domain-containing protein [Candidatus Poribacteria bacterium]